MFDYIELDSREENIIAIWIKTQNLHARNKFKDTVYKLSNTVSHLVC